ncbi:RluA family pseudouridine synthase [Aquabacterium humicola]|uniref:RluA family pseudouridine synthase n=1 Tax=Aquabacterium humicola TaxID=3237377 RepID=UPI002543AD2C|nr:RluA family pseudouridine synthase [Rubrivivax pictus]
MTTTLIHLDDALIAADKPAGLLAVPGRGPDKADCLAVRVQALHADALIVHRLDMATSGLIVFGRGAAMQRALSIAFAERRVDKTYVAIVDGLVADDEGEVNLPMICDWPNRPRQRVDHQHGKPSRTRWRVLERDPERGRTRIALQPVTGRSHQLRVHLMAIGHAMLGDELYAPPDVAAAAPRLLLHASRLQLAHPSTGDALDLHSPPPF